MKLPSIKTGLILSLTLVVLMSLVAAGLSSEHGKRTKKLYNIQEQLTCSVPSRMVSPDHPSTTPVDQYRLKDNVWISVDPGRMAGEEAWVHIISAANGKKLMNGETLEDVSGNVERVFLKDSSAQNTFLIWEAPLDQGQYHVVVDFAPLGVYDLGVDILDNMGANGVGFGVLFTFIDYIRIDPLPGNNVWDGGCTRVQGSGQSQYWERHFAYAWNNGTNGIPEDGGGDDINTGQVAATWATDVPEYLGSIDENGVFLAAIDYRCGDGLIFADYEYMKLNGETVMLSDTSTIIIAPPDWIPGDSLQVLSE